MHPIVSIVDSINIDSMTVEEKYDGPRLEPEEGSEGGKPVVTLDFMTKLMAYYKDRKTLHRRYAFQVGGCIYIFSHY